MNCLDTYALVAIARGDNAFSRYITEDFMIPDTTLAEFYWVLLRDFDERTADEWIDKLAAYSQLVEKSVLLEAIRFRHLRKKQDISFFDSVGYVFARRHNCKFVTGDKEFKGMPNVDFVESTIKRR